MYSQVRQFLQENQPISNWREFKGLIDTIIYDKPKHIRIPGLIGESYGCDERGLVSTNACLTLAFASIIVMDDLLDGDNRFVEKNLTASQLANISVAMAAAAHQTLLSIPIPVHRKSLASSILARMLMRVAHGQHLDTSDINEESAYWEIARLKSGAFFAGAFGLGGVVCDVEEIELEVLMKLGEEYGVMIQIHDDLRDSLEVPANSDWGNGRHPLPLLFAEIVDHPWQERFIHIRDQVSDGQLLREAQEILLRCGAISYGMYQIEKRYETAMSYMNQLNFENKELLVKALDELVHPVAQLIKGLSKKDH